MREAAAIGVLASAALTAGLPAVARAGFDVIEPLPGRYGSEALSVSADGCLVAGHSEYEALRWRDGVSSPLREPPDPNPAIAYALTPDGRVVVGYAGQHFFRLDEQGYSLVDVPGGAGNPTEARAVSADGYSVGGCTHAATNGMHCDWPFFWWSSGGSTLLRGLSGGIEFGSVEAISADGSLAAGTAGGRALIWRMEDGTPQDLGAGVVTDLTPNGAIAVGRSGSRAFRWTAATGMVDLGPETRIAHAVSADGSRIVGEGPDGAFIWDAGRDARRLADALRDEYGLDLGEFQLGAATAMSPDGKTIVGIGSGVNGVRGWRARLREEPCPSNPVVVDLLASYAGEPPIDGLSELATDSLGRVYASVGETANIVRIDPASPTEPPEVVLDFSGSGATIGSPSLFGVGPDDSVYASAWGSQQIHRVAPDGTSSVVFDGSAWPPLPPWSTPTFPNDLAVGADGTLFVAANARLVRVDPDGSTHQLLDALEFGALSGYPLQYLGELELGADGRLYPWFPGQLFVLDPASGAVLGRRTGLGWLSGAKPDSAGGLWLYGERIAHLSTNGVLRTLVAEGRFPDGLGGTFSGPVRLDADARGNLYYDSPQSSIVRLTPDGHATRLLDPNTRDASGSPIGPFYPGDLHVADGFLYLSDDQVDYQYGPCSFDPELECRFETPSPPRLLRVELPPVAACANGLDDDGDGLVDYPADPGCLSADDEGERSFERPCDNGIDDDRDGVADFPADPGCASLDAPFEKTECDDGLDNDGDGKIDWDGTVDEWGYPWPPDPDCAGDPRRVIEHPWYCGLGFEVAIVVLPLTQALRRWRRRDR